MSTICLGHVALVAVLLSSSDLKRKRTRAASQDPLIVAFLDELRPQPQPAAPGATPAAARQAAAAVVGMMRLRKPDTSRNGARRGWLLAVAEACVAGGLPGSLPAVPGSVILTHCSRFGKVILKSGILCQLKSHSVDVAKCPPETSH
jgi:hypothetical protein